MPKKQSKVTVAEEKKETLNNKLYGNDLSESEDSVYSGLEDEGSSDSDYSSDEEINQSADEDEDDSDDEIKISRIMQNKNNETESANQKQAELNRALMQQLKQDEVDTSDEEDIRNTVGNIPMDWYKDYQHFGYSLDGKKLIKKSQGDQLDEFLSKMEDPNYWKTVYDKTNMEEIILTDEEIAIIQRIEGGKFPEKEFDPYEPYVDYFTGEKMIHPVKSTPASKRSFIPSKWEHKKVMKIVRAIRNGWIKPKVGKDDKPKYYLLWGKDDVPKTHVMHWPAPKLKLPGHEESYNPPPEYLPTEEEKAVWLATDPEDRTQNFLSQKYDALRKVPGYSKFINEKFDRCLDLYLCARQKKVRLQIDPEDLIPKLPRPRDLQPYPTVQSLIYKGHEGVVTCISVDPTGQWLASGSTDKNIRFWEIQTARCLKAIKFDGTVHSLQWNPNEAIPVLLAAIDSHLNIINPNLGDKLLCKNVDKLIDQYTGDIDSANTIEWTQPSSDELNRGIKLKLMHQKPIKQVTWHAKGDYFATVCPEGDSKSILLHQLTKRKTQCPFKKMNGQIQCVKFHPSRPFFFVATQRYVRVYNLQKQELSKKLMSGVKWISSIDVHSQGDNIIIGSYDKRLCWFDMDLSSKPYKVLRHHKKAIRQVAYHRCYPLFASASDDGTVVVSHATVYSDLMQNPMIVPLKILRGHKSINDLGVTDITFHPHQPWIFTSGVDMTIRLFT
ncbi:ribosome biogenesis protein bop1-B isoform X1 [Hydra vulgaris]|uniref:Ribosome biogenesis protein BOP1 homolog n=1 Tax=Hydra vulgaris TaxID=6087 RepID=T2MCY7_HYDVU|nr:ribosome biogenesis protein bop1-B [Hydra vulgaris]